MNIPQLICKKTAYKLIMAMVWLYCKNLNGKDLPVQP